MKQSLTTILAASALTLGIAAPTFAQQQGAQGAQGAQPPGAEQQMPQVEVSDADLELFVKAREKVGEVRQSFQEQMAAAESSEEAQELQQAASGEMVSAVESFGLTVNEYNQIAYAIQAQPELKTRFEEIQ